MGRVEALEAGYIRLPHVKLHLREIGSGAPVLFLHGMMSSSAVWEPIQCMLGGEFRCVAADQRGHGLSDKPATGYRAQDFAEDVLAVIEALDAGPVVLVGHSLGARNAVVAAALDPKSVRSVVAIDFVPFIDSEVLDTLEARVRASDRLYRSREEIETELRARLPNLPDDAIRRRANTLFSEVEGGLRPLASVPAMVQATQGLREEFASSYKSLTCPALVVCGEKSNVVSAAALEQTRAARPDIPVLQVPDADHFVIEQAPEFCAKLIKEFVNS